MLKPHFLLCGLFAFAPLAARRGSLPLAVLAEKIDAWVAAARAT